MKRLLPLALLVPAPALAHAGESHAGWTLDLWVTGPLAVSALLYLTGSRRLWARSTGEPFTVLIVDELADLIAYQPDKQLRERAARDARR